jgi:hypothetical protein
MQEGCYTNSDEQIISEYGGSRSILTNEDLQKSEVSGNDKKDQQQQ